MAISPESLRENPIDFRAPPPSPIAGGRRSSVTNDDVLTDFLEHSLRVPDLILPDRVFPRQKSIQSPPEIDFQSLNSLENNDSITKILDSTARIGCFQLVNHGIPHDLIVSVASAGAGIFQISPEKKAIVSRSPEKPYGFEEFRGEEESEMSEEFVWYRNEGLKLEMEGIWPLGYSCFSEKMERLLSDIEKVAGKILQVLQENVPRKSRFGNGLMQGQEIGGTICYLYKHFRNALEDHRWVSSLKYDVIRMLIRGSDYSHALCLHVCDGSSEFHVYSKKGWVSFCPDKDALVITIGDQIQTWSDGQYKHVIGRPIFKGFESTEMEDDFPEFTLAEIMKMESLFKEVGEKSLNREFYQQVAVNFSCSTYRTGKSVIRWEQVQSWFQDKQKKKATKVTSWPVVRERFDVPSNACSLKPIGKRVAELSELVFEAKSSKDCAWFDVAAFLNYRVVSSGELEVRVRFAGFGNEEDEWVNVKRGVRERSIPLEPSECGRVKVGDLVLCYRENNDHALYSDAHIVGIQRRVHDIGACSCIFLVRFDYDDAEEEVKLTRICCRPT
ncbi:hypothetical protein F0562_024720 [Nyssa sinensis]|uniref:Fe2OG dioxygenase domain-containing protein n=1 Tax=Nyssa sinensis TaxID=561372 RepID=A0A5J5BGV3_9ASTE|nr:hypothetical protein F0562_024720 [Nyssa sinensis]